MSIFEAILENNRVYKNTWLTEIYKTFLFFSCLNNLDCFNLEECIKLCLNSISVKNNTYISYLRLVEKMVQFRKRINFKILELTANDY